MKPAVNQIECHPYLNQGHLIAFCSAQDIQVTAYSPLGCQDRIWSSPNDVQTPLLQNPILIGLSKKHGKSVAQIILKWQVRWQFSRIKWANSSLYYVTNFPTEGPKGRGSKMFKIFLRKCWLKFQQFALRISTNFKKIIVLPRPFGPRSVAIVTFRFSDPTGNCCRAPDENSRAH